MKNPFEASESERIINIDPWEYDKYLGSKGDMHNPQLLKWMEEKRLRFNSGLVPVIFKGEKRWMETKYADFGTLKSSDLEAKKSDNEETREITTNL